MRAIAILVTTILAAGHGIAEETLGPPLNHLAVGDYQAVGDLNGFAPEAIEGIFSGEIIARELQSDGRRQLAISLMYFLPETPEEFYPRELGARSYQIDPMLFDHGIIHNPHDASGAFERFSLPASEVARLRRVEPGGDWNFSATEIEKLRSNADNDNAAMLQALREILVDRVEAYASEGLDGIAPYARGGGTTTSAADDLRASAAPLSGLMENLKSLYRAVIEFPVDPSDELDSRMYWLVQKVQNRPSVILSHRVMGAANGQAIVAERDFYVSRVINSLQSVALGMPARGGTVVYYDNRTTTDQIPRYATSVARKIGMYFLQRELKARLQPIVSAPAE